MEENHIENEYLTPREVMSLLCIGKNKFYELVHSGELPAFRIGKLWRVRRWDLQRYCERIATGHQPIV
ncbi:helix-turn-helix domain-containing protein [Oscillibacter ruminantium]|uniref:helix-turn-helix domain-containing protein n=1 Tax=Oscillibacter ruminantium TaxID=1263547 RepID=UPI00118191E0